MLPDSELTDGSAFRTRIRHTPTQNVVLLDLVCNNKTLASLNLCK